MTRPVTESTVSIKDQAFTVWPTLMPKYSLTSQKPASLTWEKNTEPAATISRIPAIGPSELPTTSETLLRSIPTP